MTVTEKKEEGGAEEIKKFFSHRNQGPKNIYIHTLHDLFNLIMNLKKYMRFQNFDI